MISINNNPRGCRKRKQGNKAMRDDVRLIMLNITAILLLLITIETTTAFSTAKIQQKLTKATNILSDEQYNNDKVPWSSITVKSQDTAHSSTTTTILYSKRPNNNNNDKRRPRRRRRGQGDLHSNDGNDDDENKLSFNNEEDDKLYRDALALNRARTDIRNFLTQRSIQSFQFLLESCRDDATMNWLEKTYDFHNMENFHGTGAFNLTLYPTWDSMLVDLLQRPKDVVIVASRRRGGGRAGMFSKNMLASKKVQGQQFVQQHEQQVISSSSSSSSPPKKSYAPWGTNKNKVQMGQNSTDSAESVVLSSSVPTSSKAAITSSTTATSSNGYINSEEEYKQLEVRYLETQIDIDPPSLVSRIISVREQLAREWVKDIETLININDMILKAYQDQQTIDRTHGVLYNLDTVGNNENKARSVDDGIKADANPVSKDNDDESLSAGAITSSKVDSKQQPKAYDRTQMQYYTTLINYDGSASSCYRHSNLDLVSLLATQESVHRLLREYREEGNVREVSFTWLRDYYKIRVSKYFDGNQHYGRADDFIEELLLQSPVMKEIDNGKNVGLIDPLRIAEDIIAHRTDVYYDWIDTIQNVIEYDHIDLRRIILSIQMGQALEETLFKSDLYTKSQETATALLEGYDFFQ